MTLVKLLKEYFFISSRGKRMMYKFYIFQSKYKVMPGQKALLTFNQMELICPLYQYVDGFLWVIVPKIVSNAHLKEIVGKPFFKPPGEFDSFLCFRKHYYFDSFFYCSYWKNHIQVPVLIEIPENYSFGKIIPSSILFPRYPLFSRFIAALEEIENIPVAHRVVSSFQQGALDSFDVSELQREKKKFIEYE
jgi:hypothetical protein